MYKYEFYSFTHTSAHVDGVQLVVMCFVECCLWSKQASTTNGFSFTQNLIETKPFHQSLCQQIRKIKIYYITNL